VFAIELFHEAACYFREVFGGSRLCSLQQGELLLSVSEDECGFVHVAVETDEIGVGLGQQGEVLGVEALIFSQLLLEAVFLEG